MHRPLRELAASCLLLGCSGFETAPIPPGGKGGSSGTAGGSGFDAPSQAVCAADDDAPLPGTHPVGFKVVGNRIQDADGNEVFLRGVNRSGSEYRCAQGHGFFDGPCDEASVIAMKTWNINAVRVPLNESCWLGIGGVPEALALENYKRAIQSYVHLLHKHDLIPILELHWTAPGDELAEGLTAMPNVDHSVTFWEEVASTFRDDRGVIFEPFNEPYPDGNRDTEAAWACWRDGCEVTRRARESGEEPPPPYAAAGLQSLVSAIRNAGAEQLILLGGVQYSNGLSRWLEYKPDDPLENVAAAWHVYNNNWCASLDCWEGAPALLAEQYPIVATEIGQSDCEGDFITPLMNFLDQRGAGYLAWSWNVQGECQAVVPQVSDGNPWPLIDNFWTAEPNSSYALTFRDHVRQMQP